VVFVSFVVESLLKFLISPYICLAVEQTFVKLISVLKSVNLTYNFELFSIIAREIIKMDSAINKTQERLDFVTQDKEVLREYHLREMALSDWTTGIDTATEKGIEKGAMQKQFEIARNLLSEGLSIELVHKTTGLDIETIQSFKEL